MTDVVAGPAGCCVLWYKSSSLVFCNLSPIGFFLLLSEPFLEFLPLLLCLAETLLLSLRKS